MNRRRSLAALAALPSLASLAGGAGAQTPAWVAPVSRLLVVAPVLRGAFEQRKTLAGFKHALVSRGSFVVARERGVGWLTKEPFATTLVVTRDRLLSRQADGQVLSRIDARDEPALRLVNELLMAVMAADLAALAARFDVEARTQPERWDLVLTPKDERLAAWLARIELGGDRHLRSVRLLESRGDITAIRLTGHVAAATMTPEEEALFD